MEYDPKTIAVMGIDPDIEAVPDNLQSSYVKIWHWLVDTHTVGPAHYYVDGANPVMLGAAIAAGYLTTHITHLGVYTELTNKGLMVYTRMLAWLGVEKYFLSVDEAIISEPMVLNSLISAGYVELSGSVCVLTELGKDFAVTVRLVHAVNCLNFSASNHD